MLIRCCVALVFLTTSALSAATSASDDPAIVLAFGNGMRTPFQVAGLHTAVLFEDLTTNGSLNLANHALILYHQDGAVKNLAELVIFEGQASSASVTKTAQLTRAYFELVSPLLSNPTAFANALAVFPAASWLIISDIEDISSRRIETQVDRDANNILNELRAKYRVLLVSHSLGNLYANATVPSVRKLLGDNDKSLFDNLRVIGLGVPAGDLKLGQGQSVDANYITYECDGIVNMLRSAVVAHNRVSSHAAQWASPLPQNFGCVGPRAGRTTGAMPDAYSHGFRETYINSSFSINSAFIQMVQCAVGDSPDTCSALRVPSPPNAITRVPAPAAKSMSPKVSVNVQPKTSMEDLPKDRLYQISKAFDARGGSAKTAAQNYAKLVWHSWQVAAHEEKYTSKVERANYLAQIGLVCLTRTIKAHPQKSDLDENFLTFIQSTLAVDLETFKKYLFSDTLANGSALRVAEDIDNACKEADMEASKL